MKRAIRIERKMERLPWGVVVECGAVIITLNIWIIHVLVALTIRKYNN